MACKALVPVIRACPAPTIFITTTTRTRTATAAAHRLVQKTDAPTCLNRTPGTYLNSPSRRLFSAMAPLPSTMKAVQISSNGGTEVLKLNDVAVPQLEPGEVLVKNHYGGINFIDTYFRTGLYPMPHSPLTLGREGAGEVVAVHESVKNIKPGTLVAHFSGVRGSYCEYTAVSTKMVFPLPEGISTKTAAASLLQGLTALTLIKEAADVQQGQWTLVQAAAGGMGLLLCQILRTLGAKVIGTASTQAKLDLAKENGAEHTILSGDKDLVKKINEITGGHGIDAIFDGVGKATFQADLDLIAYKGTLISYGNASGAVDPVNILQLGKKNIKLMRPVLFPYLEPPGAFEKYCTNLFDLIKKNQVKITIHDVYPLSELGRAHNDLEGRKTVGKLLLEIS